MDNAAYRTDVWALAYLLRGGCSDDSLDAFRGWLILQGRKVFEATLADPDSFDVALYHGESGGMDELRDAAPTANEWREAKPMKLFVAALGASNYTYAEACPSETLPDWISVHANLFASGVFPRATLLARVLEVQQVGAVAGGQRTLIGGAQGARVLCSLEMPRISRRRFMCVSVRF